MPSDYCRQCGNFKNKGTYTLSDPEMISKIDLHSLKALPALHSEIYDGWHLRFANGHTRRANSVNILERGELPLEQKIAYCEKAYQEAGQTCHFRITPLAEPELDGLLAQRGYGFYDPTEVRLLTSLGSKSLSCSDQVSLTDKPTDAWLQALARLTDQSSEKQATFLQMIERTPLDTIFAGISENDRVVSCGLGIASADLIGLFEFATDPAFRRKGLARNIVHALLHHAARRNIETAYLQVVASNTAGSRFWQDMGFKESLYAYHYRSGSGA